MPRLLPGETWQVARGIEFDVTDDPESRPETSANAELTFTDSAGVRWKRDADHRLIEIRERRSWLSFGS
jgi:hypothetical protein